MTPPESFLKLIERARKGDPAAAGDLLGAVRPHLEGIARRYTDPGHAEESTSDLVQEAWLRAWQRLDQFRGEGGDEDAFRQFRAWAGQIVHRLGLNTRRDREAQRRRPAGRAVLRLSGGPGRSTGRGAPVVALDGGPTPSANVRGREAARLVQSALEKLPDQLDRDIVRLRVFEGLSLRDTAARLELTLDRVRGRYQAALKRLEKDLGGLA